MSPDDIATLSAPAECIPVSESFGNYIGSVDEIEIIR